MSAADALVARLPPITLVVGKGGVGKTTCAAALALRASRDSDTLVLTTDPARALPSVLDAPIGSEPTPVDHAPRLFAQALDAGQLRARFMERWGDVIKTILDRGTYLDDEDIAPLVETAMPGSDEIFAALELARLVANDNRRLFVDTAPTGHTLRLLMLPKTFRALVQLLETMQAKHRFMVRTLTHTYRRDSADAFLAEMTQLVSGLETVLGDARRCAAVVVAQPQDVVVEETRRYLASLAELGIHVAAVVWNATESAGESLGVSDQYVVPRLSQWPVGSEGLELWLKSMRTAKATDRKPRSAGSHRKARRQTDADSGSALVLRPLTIVAGKGGVGKTTVAAALALRSSVDADTLVVSTDPAPSLADALEQPIPDADTPVRGVSRLSARQMDASAAFARLRDEYRQRVDALFEGLVARGVDLAHDRAIARDLLALAPPGIDEVYALSLLADALFASRYGRVVVDPAPTGHLLRLLEMPRLALSWSHQLLRLMLKYKETVGLGDAANDLLAFAKNLRALDTILRDSQRCALVVVTLAEPVVQEETRRLVGELARREVSVSAIVLNRAGSAPDADLALPTARGAMHFEAPSVEPPPVGTDALRRWLNTWERREA